MYIKDNPLTVLLPLVFLWLFSCCHSHQDRLEEVIEEAKPDIAFQIATQMPYRASVEVSRAATQGVINDIYFINPDDYIGLYAVIPDIEGTEAVSVQSRNWITSNLRYNNKPFHPNGEGNGIICPVDGSNTTFSGAEALWLYAYYPHTSDVIFTAGNAPKIPLIVKEDQSQMSDYIYTNVPTLVYAGPGQSVTLSMRHAMARVDLKVYTNNPLYTYNRSHPVIKQIHLVTMASQGGKALNLSDGTISTYDNAATPQFDFYYDLTGSNLYHVTADKSKDDETSYTGATFMLCPADDAIDKIYVTYGMATQNTLDADFGEKTALIYDRTYSDNSIRTTSGYRYILSVLYTSRPTLNGIIEVWEEGIDEHTFTIQ